MGVKSYDTILVQKKFPYISVNSNIEVVFSNPWGTIANS